MKLFKFLTIAIATLSLSAQATPLLINGGFEDANPAGYASFASDYSQGNLYDPASIGIGSNPNLFHGSWGSFGAQEGINMLLVNGGQSLASNTVWSQTVNLTAGSYNFSGFAASTVFFNPSTLRVVATIGGNVFAIGGVALGSNVGQWDGFGGSFSLQTSSSVTLKILNLGTEYGGNDFAVDNLTLAAAAVPEGETYSTLLAGLGLLGFAAIRRRVRHDARKHVGC